MHLNLDNTITRAGFTTATLDIERETPLLVTSNLGFIGLSKKITNIVKDACVSRWIRTRCTPNWTLVNINNKEVPETDKTPWKMWLDTSLFLLAIVAIMNAIFGFSGTQTSYGLTTLLSVSFIGGLAMYTPYHYIYRHNNKPKEERPKWWFSMTVITLSFIAWFALFSLTALLPSYLNPGLSPIVILIIGVIAGVAKYFFKRHYNVQSTYAPAS